MKMVILKFSKAVIPKPRTFTGEARACLGRSRGESRVYAFKLAVGNYQRRLRSYPTAKADPPMFNIDVSRSC
jgi:hypothetical protein